MIARASNSLQCRFAAFVVLQMAATTNAFAADPANEKHAAAIERGLQFLAKEVPAWRVENGCYSCHNNGDGARALYVAKRLGHRIDSAALVATTEWLRHPERWDVNAEEEAGPSGKKLAAIQFASTLVAAIAAGDVEQPAQD